MVKDDSAEKNEEQEWNWLVYHARSNYPTFESEDLAMDTYVRAYGKMKSDHPGARRKFLACAMCFEVAECLRKKRISSVPMTHDPIDHRTSNLVSEDERVAIVQATSRLPVNLRLLLFYSIDGMSIKEIATRTGIPPSTVSYRVCIAKKMLRRILLAMGFNCDEPRR